jgi:amino acid transporter
LTYFALFFVQFVSSCFFGLGFSSFAGCVQISQKSEEIGVIYSFVFSAIFAVCVSVCFFGSGCAAFAGCD